MELEKFCYFIELRIGCIIYAILGLIINICLNFVIINYGESQVYLIISGNVIGLIACGCLLMTHVPPFNLNDRAVLNLF